MAKRIYIAVTNDVVNDRRMLRIAESLSRAGNNVSIVGRYLGKSNYESIDDVNVILIKCIFNKSFLFYAEYNLRLFFYLLFRKIDLIYSVDLDTILACGLVAKIKRKPWVFDSHEYFTEVPELSGKERIKKIWSRIGQLFVPQADLRITVGPELKEVLARKYRSPFEVVRNVGTRFNHSEDQEDRVLPRILEIVYLGVINEGRGLRQLLEAIQNIPNVRLTLLGQGDIQDEISALIHQLNLGQRVRLRGLIAADQVLPELSKYHIGVNLLEGRSESYRLSLANKCFDYIQAGLPSLQMNFPEYRAINDQYQVSHLIGDLSRKSIQEGIMVLSDQDTYRLYRSNCFKAKKFLSWEEEEKRLLKLIEPLKHPK